MFRKILCFLNKHDWIYKFDPKYTRPDYRYCPYCKRCELNLYSDSEKYYRIEDIQDNSHIDKLERIFNNS